MRIVDNRQKLGGFCAIIRIWVKKILRKYQIPTPAGKLYSPTEEVAYARKVIDTFEKAEAEGVAAIQLEGKFIDYAVVERSQRILKMPSLTL